MGKRLFQRADGAVHLLCPCPLARRRQQGKRAVHARAVAGPGQALEQLGRLRRTAALTRGDGLRQKRAGQSRPSFQRGRGCRLGLGQRLCGRGEQIQQAGGSRLVPGFHGRRMSIALKRTRYIPGQQGALGRCQPAHGSGMLSQPSRRHRKARRLGGVLRWEEGNSQAL